MTRQIRRLGLVAALMVFALLANLTYFGLVETPNLEAMSTNLRARQAEFDVNRGQILAGDTVIAESVPASDDSVFAYQRDYPDGPLYAPVTGFYSYIYGSSRVEHSSNDYLAAANSAQWLAKFMDSLTGRTAQGASVITTIDPVLQQAAWDALGGYTGAVVAMDPHTGALKAVVSTPSWDPNLLATHDLGAQQDAWTSLTTDPAEPMSDRATREIYPPGSTFKLVVAAAALDAGYTPDTLIDTPSSLPLPNSSATLTNSSNCGDGQVTLAFALEWSCNTAFANLGAALGADALRAAADKFGFDSPVLPELGGATSRFPDKLDPAELMMSAIGQYDVAASPLQMAMVTSAIANNGQLATPYLVEEVRSPDLALLYQHRVSTSQALTAPSAAALQQMMISVVANGTGTPAKIPGVTIGGKTGTAQSDPSRPNYAWFTAFAQDPDLVVTVFVQNVNAAGTDIAGGRIAGPIARAVIKASR